MKFSRIMGSKLKNDPALIAKAEEKLSTVFLDLGTKYDNVHVGSKLGGDIMVFTLMYPCQHVATESIPTAATDGQRFYWSPKFVLKQSLIGLRIICAHEAWHAIYLHPSRRGNRNPRLWNVAVDFIVNGQVMDDFTARKFDPKKMFNEHLGKFMTLEQYAQLIKDPFKPVPGFDTAELTPDAPQTDLPDPTEDRDLTEDEIKELERQENRPKFYFADPNLEKDMKRPEAIYDYLWKLLPKCETCGRIGIYKKPDPNQKKNAKNKKDEDQDGDKEQDQDQKGGKKSKKGKAGKDQGQGQKSKGKKGSKGQNQGEQDQDENDNGDEQQDQNDQGHDHSDHGQSCDCNDHGNDEQGQGDGQGEGENESDQDGQGSNPKPGKGKGSCDHGCPSCGAGEDGIDVFDLGGTVDEHMDTTESEEKLAKRISEAIETAKKMAGTVPAGLEDELGLLTAPKVTWQDLIRSQFSRSRNGNNRNDWTRFKSRQMMAGLMVPKRKSYTVNGGVLLDTSGSMSVDDMAFGVSQLQSLDEKAELSIVCGDATVYWEDMVKIKKCNAEELKNKIKVQGRGGTMFCNFFSEYEKYFGKCDFLVILSDMYLSDADVAVDPGIPVFWVCTSGNTSFVPSFGKLLQLR